MKQSVLLVGHGSRLEGSEDALNQLAHALREREHSTFFQIAFLELRSPSIPEGIEICIHQGAEEVIVLPYFVQAGRHVVEDIPKIVASERQRYPDKKIFLANYLSFDERIASLVSDRIHQARQP